MNDPANCGRSVSLSDRTYTIYSRSYATDYIPDYRCNITINSGYEGSLYSIQITTKVIDINDCGVRLSIYEGSHTGGVSLVCFFIS